MDEINFKITISHLIDDHYALEDVSIPSKALSNQDSIVSITKDLINFWENICDSKCCTAPHSKLIFDSLSMTSVLLDYANDHKSSQSLYMTKLNLPEVTVAIIDIIKFMVNMAEAYVPKKIGSAAIHWLMTLNPIARTSDTIQWLKIKRNAMPFVTPDQYEFSIVSPFMFGRANIPQEYWPNGDAYDLWNPVYNPISRDTSAHMTSTVTSIPQIIEESARYIEYASSHEDNLRMPFINPYILIGICIANNLQQFFDSRQIAHTISAMQLYTTELILNFAVNLRNYDAAYIGEYQCPLFWDMASNPPFKSANDLARESIHHISQLLQYEAGIKLEHSIL